MEANERDNRKAYRKIYGAILHLRNTRNRDQATSEAIILLRDIADNLVASVSLGMSLTRKG